MTQVKLTVTSDHNVYQQSWSGLLFPFHTQNVGEKKASIFNRLDKALRTQAEALAEHGKYKPELGSNLKGDLQPGKRLVAICGRKAPSVFELLCDIKDGSSFLLEAKPGRLLVDLKGFGDSDLELWVDAVTSRYRCLYFDAPYQGQKKKPEKRPALTLVFLVDKHQRGLVKKFGERALNLGASTNLIRELMMLPGNVLHPKGFRKRAEKEASALGLKKKFFSVSQLATMKAGAFLAVPQGSDHKDSGILRLEYKAKGNKKRKSVCLVGKGVTYDTGGVNLKPPAYMFGMQGDMGGAAVALSVILAAARGGWPVDITAYLAIADNAIGSKAYRPNDVVTSLSGKTIEIVHTDAEGRMILADTLFLASKEKSDLIIDYATLTGSCVAAIGTTYCGAFTNNEDFHGAILEAGKDSGERLWAFPLDEDFGESLKSEVADIKQCRLKGGVDHIEAAYFLKQFLHPKRDWIHFDLSACENSGGLAHIDTDVTGVGARFSYHLLEKLAF